MKAAVQLLCSVNTVLSKNAASEMFVGKIESVGC